MGKGSYRYKDRCDEKKIRERWPFPDRTYYSESKAIDKKDWDKLEGWQSGNAPGLNSGGR